jgi:hypothetical protein
MKYNRVEAFLQEAVLGTHRVVIQSRRKFSTT